MQLKDKAIFITGGASGLGAATARACARAGAHVFLVDRNQAGLDAISAEVKKLGVRCEVLAGDLAQRQFCFDAVKTAVAHFGGLDGLCNVAGFTQFHRTGDVTEEDWNKAIAVLLSAPFYLSQAAIPELIKRRGAIVNIASAAGIRGTPFTIAYNAAKAGLIHMTKCMAMEFINDPVRINVIAPGAMMTNIGASMPMPANIDWEVIVRNNAGARPPADPAGVANFIVYLLSDSTPSLHGAVIPVDDGITAM